MYTNMESGNKGTLKKKNRQTHKTSHCCMSDGRFYDLNYI